MSTLDDLSNSVLAPVENQTDSTKGAALVGYNNSTVKASLDGLTSQMTQLGQSTGATSVGISTGLQSDTTMVNIHSRSIL
jgi:hypothetical protein